MNIAQIRRHKKIRAKVVGSVKLPRLFVYRSNTHIYANLIDDEKGHTLISVSDQKIEKEDAKGTKKEKAYQIGLLLARMALQKKITNVVFDRGGHLYHGRVRAVADGARAGGLQF